MRSLHLTNIFALLLICLSAGLRPVSAQQIAFTWDDLPAHSALPAGTSRLQIANDILSAMKSAGLPPAYGFVNGVRLTEEPASAAVLPAWRAAHMPLGNHTWSHMNLNEHTAQEWEADLLRNEPILRNAMEGKDWHWLRFPYLAEGDTPEKRSAVRAFLAAHGYRIAGVTMSFGDYAWNEPYARCLAKGDSAAVESLESSYLAAAQAHLTYTRSMAHTLYGHDIPYVLLMHVGALDAKLLPRLLTLYRQQGASFITLEQAEADPFYACDMDPSRPCGPPTLESALHERHLSPPPIPQLPDFSALCR